MRDRLRRLTLLLVALLLPLSLAELGLRSCAPLHLAGFQGGYVYDPELGYRIRPGQHYLVNTDHLQEIRTNALGSVNFQESFAGYEQRVFAIGDSFTQGTGLSADSSYPFQLDLFLNLRGGEYAPEYGVVNLGLAAYGLEQATLALRRYAEQIGRPDFVLYLACSNDAGDDALFASGYRHGHLVDGSPSWGVWQRPLQLVVYQTEIGKRLKIALGALRRSWTSGTPVTAEQDANPGARNAAAPLEPGLERLLALTRSWDAELIVGWTGWIDERGGSYEWLRAWAERNGVRFADWHPRAASVVRAVPELPVSNPHSGGHHRPWVNRLIAETFGEQILAAAESRASCCPSAPGAADAGSAD